MSSRRGRQQCRLPPLRPPRPGARQLAALVHRPRSRASLGGLPLAPAFRISVACTAAPALPDELVLAFNPVQTARSVAATLFPPERQAEYLILSDLLG